jgi:hypothetical protein
VLAGIQKMISTVHGELASLRNKLLHRPIRFADRVAVIRSAGKIRIRERNPPVRLIP